jgi:hypothetical protein
VAEAHQLRPAGVNGHLQSIAGTWCRLIRLYPDSLGTVGSVHLKAARLHARIMETDLVGQHQNLPATLRLASLQVRVARDLFQTTPVNAAAAELLDEPRALQEGSQRRADVLPVGKGDAGAAHEQVEDDSRIT